MSSFLKLRTHIINITTGKYSASWGWSGLEHHWFMVTHHSKIKTPKTSGALSQPWPLAKVALSWGEGELSSPPFPRCVQSPANSQLSTHSAQLDVLRVPHVWPAKHSPGSAPPVLSLFSASGELPPRTSITGLNFCHYGHLLVRKLRFPSVHWIRKKLWLPTLKWSWSHIRSNLRLFIFLLFVRVPQLKVIKHIFHKNVSYCENRHIKLS